MVQRSFKRDPNPYSILLNSQEVFESNIFTNDDDELSLLEALKDFDNNPPPDIDKSHCQRVNASLIKQSPVAHKIPSGNRNQRIIGNFPSDLELRYEKIHSPKNGSKQESNHVNFDTKSHSPESLGLQVK